MICPTRVVLLALGVFLFFAGSAGACFIVGDLNGDCQVGIGDLLLVADQWLSPGICSEQGLVGHWKLDEETGAVAADSAGNDRHGVVFGGALWNPEGGKTGGLSIGPSSLCGNSLEKLSAWMLFTACRSFLLWLPFAMQA